MSTVQFLINSCLYFFPDNTDKDYRVSHEFKCKIIITSVHSFRFIYIKPKSYECNLFLTGLQDWFMVCLFD